jgi:hypothetical protein
MFEYLLEDLICVLIGHQMIKTSRPWYLSHTNYECERCKRCKMILAGPPEGKKEWYLY